MVKSSFLISLILRCFGEINKEEKSANIEAFVAIAISSGGMHAKIGIKGADLVEKSTF